MLTAKYEVNFLTFRANEAQLGNYMSKRVHFPRRFKEKAEIILCNELRVVSFRFENTAMMRFEFVEFWGVKCHFTRLLRESCFQFYSET